MLLYILNSVAYGRNFLCVLIRNLNVELFLELHDELYGVKRICAKIICEASLGGNVFGIYIKPVFDNINNFRLNL